MGRTISLTVTSLAVCGSYDHGDPIPLQCDVLVLVLVRPRMYSYCKVLVIDTESLDYGITARWELFAKARTRTAMGAAVDVIEKYKLPHNDLFRITMVSKSWNYDDQLIEEMHKLLADLWLNDYNAAKMITVE